MNNKKHVISNEKYEEALVNKDNQLIMDQACSRYRRSMTPDELYRCKLIALWSAMQNWNENGGNFSSFLYKRVGWECLKTISENKKFNKHFISCLLYDFSDEKNNNCNIDLDKILDVLPEKELKDVLIQRFVYNMTLTEIGRRNNFSYETARKRIILAIKYLQKNLTFEQLFDENGV